MTFWISVRALCWMCVVAMFLGAFEALLHRFGNPDFPTLLLCSTASVLSVRDEEYKKPGHSEE